MKSKKVKVFASRSSAAVKVKKNSRMTVTEIKSLVRDVIYKCGTRWSSGYRSLEREQLCKQVEEAEVAREAAAEKSPAGKRYKVLCKKQDALRKRDNAVGEKIKEEAVKLQRLMFVDGDTPQTRKKLKALLTKVELI